MARKWSAPPPTRRCASGGCSRFFFCVSSCRPCCSLTLFLSFFSLFLFFVPAGAHVQDKGLSQSLQLRAALRHGHHPLRERETLQLPPDRTDCKGGEWGFMVRSARRPHFWAIVSPRPSYTDDATAASAARTAAASNLFCPCLSLATAARWSHPTSPSTGSH